MLSIGENQMSNAYPRPGAASLRPTLRRTVCLLALMAACIITPPNTARAEERHRVLVSTDIGGSDPDDFQSMVHLLLYSDALEIEGLVASPWGPGRTQDILDVIDVYEQDYHRLLAHSGSYPEPAALRAVTRQGAVDVAPYAGTAQPTEGSEWIIEVARRNDPRPLHVLVWGGIEDLAQALHDAPDILPRLRVYYIGGPNKKWSSNAYQYIVENHRRLWMIESNSTYRGWFVGGGQSGHWGNKSFVTKHIAGHGALGDYFAGILGGRIKMGDTPSVAWLLHGTPADPSLPGWGGRYVRAWGRDEKVYERITTASDEIEQFGILEFMLPVEAEDAASAEAQMDVDNQSLIGHVAADGTLRFRFSPKEAKTYGYTIRSTLPTYDGVHGEVTAIRPSAQADERPDPDLPDWWTDDPDPAAAEGPHMGAKTVSRWRSEFLQDFADRLDRAGLPPGPTSAAWGDAVLHYPGDWYSAAPARELAENVALWQSPEGAWPKNTDLSELATTTARQAVIENGRANTIDNDATVLPLRFLAKVARATGDEELEMAFLRGLDYLLAAQYPNGGWPQYFPLRDGYFSRITFNDNAMINVMSLLRDVAGQKPDFAFVSAAYRARAGDAVERGLDVVLKTQIRQDGKLTAWCAQYDQVTLAPAWARAYEPPSLSGMETVRIVRFLMQIENPSAAQIAAVEAAVEWLKSVAIYDLKYLRIEDEEGLEDALLVAEPGAGPLWARFYDLHTNRPIFTGRDSVIHLSLDELEQERRGGYGYYGSWAQSLIDDEYPNWTKRIARKGS
jgi:PelA/Pel-15E family pectate lyase